MPVLFSCSKEEWPEPQTQLPERPSSLPIFGVDEISCDYVPTLQVQDHGDGTFTWTWTFTPDPQKPLDAWSLPLNGNLDPSRSSITEDDVLAATIQVGQGEEQHLDLHDILFSTYNGALLRWPGVATQQPIAYRLTVKGNFQQSRTYATFGWAGSPATTCSVSAIGAERIETCAYIIGYWMTTGWENLPDVNGSGQGVVTLAGYSYSRDQLQFIWNYGNGQNVFQQLFLQAAAIRFSQTDVSADVWALVQEAEYLMMHLSVPVDQYLVSGSPTIGQSGINGYYVQQVSDAIRQWTYANNCESPVEGE